jgi:uncharacterized protein (TIGR00369 family)
MMETKETEERTSNDGSIDEKRTVYLPTYDGCYVCGQNHPRGLRVRFFTDGGIRVHARFLPDATQTGYDDNVHGGVISTLLDELLGWSVSLTHHSMAYTAELTVRFLKPLHAGSVYLASSRMGSGRGRYWEADGEVADADGQVFARGHGKYFLLSAEQTDAVAAKMTYLPGDLRAFDKIVR